MPLGRLTLLVVAFCSLPLTRPAPPAAAGDQAQWGQAFSRNMVSDERGLPETFDPATGKNIKWSVPLGSHGYSTAVIAEGRVLIGANNAAPRDARHEGIRGVLLCLDEATGKMLWQLVVPKFEKDLAYLDFGPSGICSSATVQGDRVYIVSNRAEVMCLDIHGQANGNDGPYLDEGRLMARTGQPPLEVAATDADVLWTFDMTAEVGIHHHDSAHSSILIHGPYLYLNTGNGVNRTHSGIPAPDAPSLIVLDKTTGELVAQDGERIGPRIFHCTWSSPSLGVVNGQPLIFFGGGDGVCYAFKAVDPATASQTPRTLERVWRFDGDPDSPKEDVHQFVGNRQVSPSNIWSAPVFYRNRVYLTVGGDFYWGKREARLMCLDATLTGDISKTGLKWSYDLSQHVIATPAIWDGLVFVGDCGRKFHCVDAETGRVCWTHETKGVIWSSALAADGKVYVGNKRGEFLVFQAAREKHLISEIDLQGETDSTPVAANGVLYVNTLDTLYAVSAHPTP